MTTADEYALAQAEVVRRGMAGGSSESDMLRLLAAFEAGALRSYAATLRGLDETAQAADLEGWARGVRPRGWRDLLNSGGA